MPRTSRASRGGFVYHVLNRGNGGNDIFQKDEDFAAFVNLMREAHEKVPMRLIGLCLITNHFHLPLWPQEEGDLSRTRSPSSSARQWQGARLAGGNKAFPFQSDEHHLTVLRYVERNPLRANMVHRS